MKDETLRVINLNYIYRDIQVLIFNITNVQQFRSTFDVGLGINASALHKGLSQTWSHCHSKLIKDLVKRTKIKEKFLHHFQPLEFVEAS